MILDCSICDLFLKFGDVILEFIGEIDLVIMLWIFVGIVGFLVLGFLFKCWFFNFCGEKKLEILWIMVRLYYDDNWY